MLLMRDCPNCEGEGGYMETCGSCNGAGCAWCNWSSEVGIACSECGGSGKVDDPETFSIFLRQPARDVCGAPISFSADRRAVAEDSL